MRDSTHRNNSMEYSFKNQLDLHNRSKTAYICSVCSVTVILRKLLFLGMGLSHIHSGARTSSKNRTFGEFRPLSPPAAVSSYVRRDSFFKPYGLRGAELAAPDFPGVFIWPLGRRKPVKDP